MAASHSSNKPPQQSAALQPSLNQSAAMATHVTDSKTAIVSSADTQQTIDMKAGTPEFLKLTNDLIETRFEVRLRPYLKDLDEIASYNYMLEIVRYAGSRGIFKTEDDRTILGSYKSFFQKSPTTLLWIDTILRLAKVVPDPVIIERMKRMKTSFFLVEKIQIEVSNGWLRYGEGREFEKDVDQFNATLKILLTKHNAHDAFKEAIRGEDPNKHFFYNFNRSKGLNEGETDGLIQFFQSYPEIYIFFENELKHKHSRLMQAHKSLKQFLSNLGDAYKPTIHLLDQPKLLAGSVIATQKDVKSATKQRSTTASASHVPKSSYATVTLMLPKNPSSSAEDKVTKQVMSVDEYAAASKKFSRVVNEDSENERQPVLRLVEIEKAAREITDEKKREAETVLRNAYLKFYDKIPDFMWLNSLDHDRRSLKIVKDNNVSTESWDIDNRFGLM